MIELRHITKRFANALAVNDVSLTIATGELVTLLGPSGCGKTTLLRLIGGFETPDAGQVFLNGVDVSGFPPYRRDVNQVFQSYALFPHLSVADNVAFGLRIKRIPRHERNDRVAEALALVKLNGLEQRKPAQLSGGQKQRVALARAIVNRPKVLLLDEPLAALDAQLRHGMQLELKELQRQLGITFVLVTHDQEEALVMSDRIAVMNAGTLEMVGSAADVYSRPTGLFTAQFVGQANCVAGTVIGRDGQMLTVRSGLAQTLQVLAEANSDHQIGQPLTLMIRPELIALTDATDSFRVSNSIPGRVVEKIFRGQLTQYRVLCDGGLSLLVTQTAANAFTADARVICTIAAEAIVPLGAA